MEDGRTDCQGRIVLTTFPARMRPLSVALPLARMIKPCLEKPEKCGVIGSHGTSASPDRCCPVFSPSREPLNHQQEPWSHLGKLTSQHEVTTSDWVPLVTLQKQGMMDHHQARGKWIYRRWIHWQRRNLWLWGEMQHQLQDSLSWVIQLTLLGV